MGKSKAERLGWKPIKDDPYHNIPMKGMLHTREELKVLCETGKHLPRDNKFGVTWCILCGRLFKKPCGKPILK